MDLDRLVELGVFHLLQKRNRFLQRVGVLLHRLPRLGDVFP